MLSLSQVDCFHGVFLDGVAVFAELEPPSHRRGAMSVRNFLRCIVNGIFIERAALYIGEFNLAKVNGFSELLHLYLHSPG